MLSKFFTKKRIIISSVILASIGLIIAIGLLWCYFTHTPDCSDKRTKDLVMQIFRDKLVSEVKEHSPYITEEQRDRMLSVTSQAIKTSRLHYIRVVEYNKDIQKYTCVAELIATVEGKDMSRSITYTSEMLRDTYQFYVEVYFQ